MDTVSTLSRDALSKALGGNPRVVAAFERQAQQVQDTSDGLTTQAAATDALQDASFITLAPNATLTGERVLHLGGGLSAIDGGDTLTIRVDDTVPHVVGGHQVVLTVVGGTNLTLPLSGALATLDDTRAPALPGPYASDAAAGTAGVVSGRMYKSSDGAGGFNVKMKA